MCPHLSISEGQFAYSLALAHFFQFFFFHSQAEVLFLTELSSTVLYLFKREQHRKGKAKLRGVTKQVLMKLSSFAPYLKAWCFFVVGKIRRATDLFSFTGAECILPAIFNVMFLPVSFAQSGMPFDLCLTVLGLFIFQALAVQVPTFLCSLPWPSKPLFIYFQNTAVCFTSTEVTPYVWVCLARRYGQGLTFLVSGSFLLSPFPLTVFSNMD